MIGRTEPRIIIATYLLAQPTHASVTPSGHRREQSRGKGNGQQEDLDAAAGGRPDMVQDSGEKVLKI